MSALFNQVQFSKPKKNKFNLSHERKMSMKMGNLTPCFLQEIVPGDSFRVNAEMLLRLQPLVSPMFHRLNAKMEFFFVPNRLVWDDWQDFITGGAKGSTPPIMPNLPINETTKGGFIKGSLADYFGVPTLDPSTTIVNPTYINALPFRAYQLIYNEYYRDQDLVTEVPFSKGQGNSESDWGQLLQIRKRAWEKDYFTSARPWAQKGDPVNIPTSVNYKLATIARDVTGNPLPNEAGIATGAGGDLKGTTSNTGMIIDNVDDIGITINDLRTSARVQEWLERTARAGSRYIETILSFFGVMSSDARLQRPEFLGGGTQPIVVSEVLSTFQLADDTGYPQGNMTGHGVTAGNIMGFNRTFEEHGFVIGLMSVLPRTAYQQGLPKTFSRVDKFDYYWPTFAQLGEQEILNKELYFDPTGNTGNDLAFGYQSRYAEYKYQPSTVHGDFRDNLNYWHMGRIFSSLPALNGSFITADPTKRVFAVTDETIDEILVQLYHRVDALRPMPYFNNPTL